MLIHPLVPGPLAETYFKIYFLVFTYLEFPNSVPSGCHSPRKLFESAPSKYAVGCSYSTGPRGIQNFEKVGAQIHSNMWCFNGRIFMVLLFPMLFEFEFFSTHSFLCCLLQFSLKVIVNVIDGRNTYM